MQEVFLIVEGFNRLVKAFGGNSPNFNFSKTGNPWG